MLELVGVFLVWFAMWFVYRYITAELVRGSAFMFSLLSIILAPTLTLLPPVLWWRWRRRERGLPYLLTRRNLFSSVALASVAALLFAVANNLLYPVLMLALGLKGDGGVHVFAPWRAQTLDWLLTQTFLYMIIVGPVEELFNRGFLMDQANRAFKPWVGIGLSSVLFVLGHVPIDFLVYRVDLWGWAGRWASSLPFALAMGIYYQWCRNIWGPAVYHGLYDWFLGIFWIGYMQDPMLTNGQAIFILLVLSVMEFLIIVGIGYVGYRLWWKGSRPAGSLGFGARATSLRGSVARSVGGTWAFLRRRPIIRYVERVDRAPLPVRQAMSLAVIALVLLGTLGVTGVLGVVPGGGGAGPGDGGGGGGGGPATLTFNDTGHASEGETVELDYGDAPMQVVGINAMVMWTDEPAFNRRYTNLPDTFSLELALPDGTSLVTDQADSGQVQVSWTAEKPVAMDQIVAIVTAVSCGDQVPLVSPIGLRTRADTGNDFHITVEVRLAEAG